MELSARVKLWLVENCGVKNSATDEEFKAAAGQAIATGKLSLNKLAELNSTKSMEDADEFTTLLKGLGSTLGEIKSILEEDEEFEEEDFEEKSAKGCGGGGKKKKPPTSEGSDMEEEEEMPEKKSVNTKKGGRIPSQLEKMVSQMGAQNLYDDNEEKTFDIRVKEAADQYDHEHKAMTYPMMTKGGKAHPLAGRVVTDFAEKGRVIDTASNRDKAIAGAWGKFMVRQATLKSRNLAFNGLPQHDKELILYAMENEKWGGASDGDQFSDIKDRKLTPREQKALIDDSTSGGLEAAPIVFDDMVIQTPLLFGELFPLVNTIPLDRGRRIEGVATGTVSSSWGGVDDTDIALFNTTSYVTAFDTTIFRWEGAVRIGLDFLSDTPIDFGAHITAQYGERLLEDLDDVIATGNGSTQPEGVMTKGSTTSINFGSATTLGNYESLRFGVAKPEHRANLLASAVFCGTETSYQRARAIPVGASDARRLGGSQNTIGGVTNYGDYSWMGVPYKINESLGNNEIFYAILARYRMYRRRGFTMKSSTEGDTLLRKNSMLMIATARYGGQLERGACAAVTTTAPS